jgi:hypothetical protein
MASVVENLYEVFNDPIVDARRGEQLRVENIFALLSRYGLELPPSQYLRELVENSLEALARRENWEGPDGKTEAPLIRIHPAWNAFEKYGACQFALIDNGVGFLGKENLRDQSKTLVKTGNAENVSLYEGNFGQGGRISTLYWNPYGVIYASWHKGEGWMIRLRINPSTGQPELFEFPVEGPDGSREYEAVIPAPDEFKFGTIKENGTAVVLLGKDGKSHTYGGPAKKLLGKGVQARSFKVLGGMYSIHHYLNNRFYTLPSINGVPVRLSVFTHNGPYEEWPRTAEEARGKTKEREDGTTYRNTSVRRIHGWRYYQEQLVNEGFAVKGVISGPSRDKPVVDIEWYFIDAEKAKKRTNSVIRSLAQIGVICGHEIYENDLEDQFKNYSLFGIYRRSVAKQVTILIKPRQATDGDPRGVSPDGGRTHLLWNHPKSPTTRLPMEHWADLFEAEMPQVIRDALTNLSDSVSSEDLNKDLKKDLKPYLKDLRRHYKRPDPTGTDGIGGTPGTIDTTDGPTGPTTTGGCGPGGPGGPGGGGGVNPPVVILPPEAPTAEPGSTIPAKKINKKLSIPEVLPLTAVEALAEGISEGQIARYVEEKHLILFNTGWKTLEDQVQKHSSKHRGLPGAVEVIRKQMILTYSTSLIEKILEHYKHKGSPDWPTDIWRQQLSVEALTFACGDKLNFDTRLNSSLGQRIGKMKREASITPEELTSGVAAMPTSKPSCVDG